MTALGIDVGGSGIKAALVDTDRGALFTERIRVDTPQPATPDAVAAATSALVSELVVDVPVGVGLPSVVLGGHTMTAANIHESWIGQDAESLFRDAVGRMAVVVNDADAAGIAEMRFGAGRGERGVVIVLTLGTGIGSAVFIDGVLVPNTELGHLEIGGRVGEAWAASSAKEREQLSWTKWAARVSTYLDRIDRLFWPDLIVLGGGVSRKADRWMTKLTCRPRIVAAEFGNAAGIVGAALAAASVSPPGQTDAVPVADVVTSAP